VRLIEKGANFVDSEKEARLYASKHALTYISPYNDVDAIGAYATVGFEIEQW
jgi:threonine dehydratase